MSDGKKIGGIGPFGIPYTTTGPLEDKTPKIEAWMNWCNETYRELATGTEEEKALADGIKLAMARFMVEFSQKKEEGS